MVDINPNSGGYNNVQPNKTASIAGNNSASTASNEPVDTNTGLPAIPVPTTQLPADVIFGYMGNQSASIAQNAHIASILAGFNNAFDKVKTAVASENLGLSDGAQDLLALHTMNTLMDGSSASGNT